MSKYYTPHAVQENDKVCQTTVRTTLEQQAAIENLIGGHSGIRYQSEAIRYLLDLGIQQLAKG